MAHAAWLQDRQARRKAAVEEPYEEGLAEARKKFGDFISPTGSRHRSRGRMESRAGLRFPRAREALYEWAEAKQGDMRGAR